jgi:hypothetical protein
MTAWVDGPVWSERGLDQRAGRYPLQVEGPVLRAVELLVPGVSTVTRYARHYALYAALAAHAQQHDLDAAACQRLLRRSEVILAAASFVDDESGGWPGPAHGIDRVRLSLDDELDVAGAAEVGASDRTYSPRPWGFWAQYGGPSVVLGTVAVEDGTLRPGRHTCPAEVMELFAPLFAAASHDRLSHAQLEALQPAGLQSEDVPEVSWLRDLFTATRGGLHEADEWQADDRRRRAALRMIGQTTVLYGAETELSWEEAVQSAVVFGDQIKTDPVLAGIREMSGWRGVLLRNYSVGAWRRLWAGLVKTIGEDGEDSDRSQEELRAWLADQMPSGTVQAFVDDLPSSTAGGHPAPAERIVLTEGDASDPLTNVRLLLLGGQRAGELDGEVRTAFLGTQHDILNPMWVALRSRDFRDRPLCELAAQLVDDMLAQSRRVALAKMRPDGAGRLKVFSRVHQRNGRYYKTSNEGDASLGTRIEQLAGFAVQLGLIDLYEDGSATVTPDGSTLLAVGA